MGITVSHALSATTPDDPLYEIQPQHWNSAHEVTFVPDATEVIKWASAGTQSISSGTLVFGNSNGVSFGMSNGTITATVVPGAAAGIAAVQAGTQTATSGTVVFANSNGITAGMSGSSQITFSHNGLTTQTVQTQNMVSVLGSTGNISFANGNGITFGANASTITASHNGITSQSAQTQNVVVPSAGTQTATSGTVVFSNNAAITFGMSNNSVITATHNGITTGRASTDAIGLNTALTANGVSMTANSSGLSLNFPAFLTTAALSGDTTKYAGVSSGTQTTAGTNIVMTHNTAGLNLGVPAYITTAALSGDTTKFAGTGTTFNGVNISGSMTMNTAGLQLSMSVAAPGGGGGAAISAGANSTNAGTVVFSNSNGVSFGMDGAGVITATVVPGAAAGIAAVAAGTQTQTSGTLVFANSNGLTFGLSGSSQLTGSYTVPASSSLVGGSNVTIATAGSTISINAQGFLTMNNWRNMPLGNNTTYSTLGQNSVYLQHFIPDAVLQFSNVEILGRGTFVSSTNSKVYAQTIDYGLYSQDTGTASTRMSLMSSSQILYSASYNSNTEYGFTISQGAGSFTTSSGATGIVTNISGACHNYMPMTATLQPNVKYALGLRMSSATTIATGPWAWAPLAMSVQTSNQGRIYVSTTNAVSNNVIGDREMGVYQTTTTAMPNSYATSNLAIAVSRQNLYIQFE